MELSHTTLCILIGVGLSCAIGFKIILPVFVLSLLSYFGEIELNESYSWLSSKYTLVALGIAFCYETLSTLIPGLAGMQKFMAVFIAPLVAFWVSVAILPSETSEFIKWSSALICGTTSFGVAATTSGIRASTAFVTGGANAPVSGGVEIGASLLSSILAMICPILIPIFIIIVCIILFFVIRKILSIRKLKKSNV